MTETPEMIAVDRPDWLEDLYQRARQQPDTVRLIGQGAAGQPFEGFVELEDSWGDEARIVDTARISTTRARVGRVERMQDRDWRLLEKLFSENHGTPFETVYVRFRLVAPIFVLRQFVKHRISSWNEMSLRYRKPLGYSAPLTADLRGPVLSAEDAAAIEAHNAAGQALYQEIYAKALARIAADETLDAGERAARRARARELCRYSVGVAEFSDIYWTLNARSLFNLFALRLKPTAQLEARRFAVAMHETFSHQFPRLGEFANHLGESH